MRLCRFGVEDTILAGFYYHDLVVPIDQARDAYCEAQGVDLILPSADELLVFLPPEGTWFLACQELWQWVNHLSRENLAELAMPLRDVKLLAPIQRPNKILLLAGNYADHIVERGGQAAEREETFPYVFLKPPSTTLTHPFAPILIPRSSPNHIDWECELGVVMGRRCRGVNETDALDYVAGYTVINDVSDRQFMPNPSRKPRDRDKFFDWMHGKWHDTFCPMGPCILSADSGCDPQGMRLQLLVNGVVRQDSTTEHMIFSVPAIIAFISAFVTLEPGDILSTGTPSGVGSASGTYLRPGDLVVASIDEIGDLENPIVAEAE